MERTRQMSEFQTFGVPASEIVNQTLKKLGDLNTILSKSRLRLKFDALFKQAIKGENFDFNLLQSLLVEVSSFRLDQYEFIRGVTRNFIDEFNNYSKTVYSKHIDQQLSGIDYQSEEDEVIQQNITQIFTNFEKLFKIFSTCIKIIQMIENGFPQLQNLQLELYDAYRYGLIGSSKTDLKKIARYFFMYGFQEFENLCSQKIAAFFQRDPEDSSEIPIIHIEGDVADIIFGESQGNLPQQYNSLLGQMQAFTQILITIGWPEFIDNSYEKILQLQVEKYLDQIKGVFAQPTLKIIQSYLESVTQKWIQAVLNLNNYDNLQIQDQKRKIQTKWKCDLEKHLLSQYVNQRTKDMFQIFQEFPDSLPAINDFKYALDKTKLHKFFANQIKEQFSQRLLLPGVITFMIIEHYIQAIRVIKLIDPSTILLEIISEPIKDHLRQRQDTLRCIVQSILADESELYDQLGQAYVRIPLRGNKKRQNDYKSSDPTKSHHDDDDDYISSDEDEHAAENWEPLPIQNDMKDFFISAKRKKTDIISTLVNIYGSQDAFLKVYKSMLEERLLSGNEVKQENEIKNLELMKLRFGDQNLHACDVMLRDIKESERIRTAIRKALEQKQAQKQQAISGSKELPLNSFNACIISKGYWDQVLDDDTSNVYQPPAFLKKTYEDFSQYYQSFKRIRTVNFRPQLGSVNLTLHFDNGSFKFRVTPIQAAIITMFDDENSKNLSAEYIAKELDIAVDDLRRKIAFWVCKGVLKEKKVFKQIGTSHYRSTALLSNQDVEIVYSSVDTLELKGDQSSSDRLIEANELIDYGAQDQIIKIQQIQSQDDEKLVRSFVINIINNSNQTGGCNFDKIFSMLKNVYMVGQHIQKAGLEELLQKIINEQKISFNLF
eukprot:403366657